MSPAEVGSGVIDFKRIFDNAGESGMKYFFVEQDGAPQPLQNIAMILILGAERGIIKGLWFILGWLGSLTVIVAAVARPSPRLMSETVPK